MRYDQQNGLPRLPAYTVLRPYCEDDDGGLWLAAGRTNQNTSLRAMWFKDGRFTVYGMEAGLVNKIVNDIFKDPAEESYTSASARSSITGRISAANSDS